jgi:D-serine dehydratase
VGIDGGRTGVRAHADALALAEALNRSPAVRLVGIECYEGLGVTGDSAADAANVDALMARVDTLAHACDEAGWFDSDEVIVSAGGSALFDLVAARMRPVLSRPVRGLLRSGCYITHDHGHYKRLVHQVAQRCGCADELHSALEVWTTVQSAPEPGLALLTGGRRDLSFDVELPRPLKLVRAGQVHTLPADGRWRIQGLNDQHAHLRFDDAELQPHVGDLVALGISHPCTTFDKWHWMPVVDDDYRVVDAVTMHF